MDPTVRLDCTITQDILKQDYILHLKGHQNISLDLVQRHKIPLGIYDHPVLILQFHPSTTCPLVCLVSLSFKLSQCGR